MVTYPCIVFCELSSQSTAFSSGNSQCDRHHGDLGSLLVPAPEAPTRYRPHIIRVPPPIQVSHLWRGLPSGDRGDRGDWWHGLMQILLLDSAVWSHCWRRGLREKKVTLVIKVPLSRRDALTGKMTSCYGMTCVATLWPPTSATVCPVLCTFSCLNWFPYGYWVSLLFFFFVLAKQDPNANVLSNDI